MRSPAEHIPDDAVRRFRRKILAYYKKHGRDLPFRHTTDSYQIAVAEIMLQQTQAERVVEKFLTWIKRWPTWQSLATASTRELLEAWSGLGYNRRAIFLGRMAHVVVNDYGGILPEEPDLLRKLPGIGDYTANAIAIFAFNKPVITIDTNIRKVFLLEFNLPDSTSKEELAALAGRALPRGRSRDWHNALMDYSRLALRTPERRIAPLSRQSRFKGSRRQLRGELVRQLTGKRRVSLTTVATKMNRTLDEVREAALTLQAEGLVRVTARTVQLQSDRITAGGSAGKKSRGPHRAISVQRRSGNSRRHRPAG